MGTKAVIGTGLLAGILVGGLALGGVVTLIPPPPAPGIPDPSPIVLATPAPSASPAPTTTPPPAPTPAVTRSASPSTAPAKSQGFAVGQPAPGLRLAKFGGGTIDLLEMRGRPVWLTFMATWCPECGADLPRMASFGTRYAKTGLSIVLVDVKEPGTDVGAYLKSLGVSFPVALDDTGTAAIAWQARALPTHVWITSRGVIAASAARSVGADQMAADLSTILPGVDVKP